MLKAENPIQRKPYKDQKSNGDKLIVVW